ncbi:tol-pal system-associated acyl-CoA thioesterase [Psychrosphaera haliotis]|uniref:Tol-pal system-associated acyl-CoA thioesterase n=1 Tax=Psychrosphaera haliotis TaxID=555083 RepID=A0A6N8F5N4_9GAMM|nr:tol-pal system-associated acyl-CoA thioesterase [Psychrosphaera haliotis]
MFNFLVKVYYEDTDAGGIVYHANYLKYCERARTELLLSLGIEQDVYLKQNIGFVVSSMEIGFKLPARLHQALMVKTEIVKLKRASIEFRQVILNEQQDTVFEACVIVACINSEKGKPQVIPPEILGVLKSAS